MTVKVPYYHQGIKVLSTGMSLVLEIPVLQVVITFGITGFSISLPPREFVNNTKGHCGKDPLPPSTNMVHLELGDIFVIVLYLQEHATTTRLMTVCCLEASWYRIVK